MVVDVKAELEQSIKEKKMETPKIKPKEAVEIVNKFLAKDEYEKAREFIMGCDFGEVKEKKDAELIKELWVLRDFVNARILKKNPELKEEEETTEDYLKYDRNGKVSINIAKFTDYILDNFTFKTIFGTKKDLIFVYDHGTYKLKGEETIKTFSEDKLGEHSVSSTNFKKFTHSFCLS